MECVGCGGGFKREIVSRLEYGEGEREKERDGRKLVRVGGVAWVEL